MQSHKLPENGNINCKNSHIKSMWSHIFCQKKKPFL